MLITLWAILLAFSFILIVLGLYSNMIMSDVFLLVGYFFLFVLGSIMIFNGVYSSSGVNEVTSYNYTTNELNESLVDSTSVVKTNVLTPYETGSGIISYVDNARIIGLFIALVGAFGFITFWIDNRRYKELKQEEFEEVDYED